ncbi:MAG: PLP-dependent aminotransferase family protein, partial [Haloechinothrix sp.]
MPRTRLATRWSNSPIRALVEVRRDSSVALHTQVESALREAVRSQRLVPGAKMPPSRQLAVELGVTRRVVVEAYDQLVAEGYLVSRTGAGTWVAGKVAPRTRELASRVIDASPAWEFDLRPGMPDLSAFPRASWVSASRRVVEHRPHQDLGYDNPTGHFEARTTIAGWLTRTRAALTGAHDVVLTSGVAQAMALIARVLARRGITKLAVENPGHPDQRCSLERLGFSLVPIPVDEYGIRVEAIEASAAQAVLVTPAHQFPTGV